MKLLITFCGTDDWSVWATTDGEHPIRGPHGFIVGIGATRDEAVASAVADLEAAVEELQLPPGNVDVEEVDR